MIDDPHTDIVVLISATLFGWVWGSFLNTLVDRTPKLDGSGPRVTFLQPARSQCLACGAAIPWRDNLPILSYLRLGGRCRACGVPFGLRTLGVEALTPLAFLAIALWVPWGRWFVWAGAAVSVALVGIPVLAEQRRRKAVRLAAPAVLIAAVIGLLL